MSKERDGRRNLVIDLGGTRLRVALADDVLRLSHRVEERTVLERGFEGTLGQMVRMARDVMARGGPARVQAISSPGPLNANTGMVFDPPNLPGWHDIPLQKRLEEAIGVPATILNDANAAALGEFHAGSGRGTRNLVYLTISTGIGGGVVVDGKLLEGSSGTAGELGHMTIDRHGPMCRCGNIGCLEILASGTSIARRFNEALAAGKWSVVSEWVGDRTPTAADVARAAAAGDPLASAIWTDACECIGSGIVNCIHIFNPDVVTLGGGVTQTREIFEIVARVVEQYTLRVPREAVRIVPAQTGEDAGLIGAAVAARELADRPGVDFPL